MPAAPWAGRFPPAPPTITEAVPSRYPGLGPSPRIPSRALVDNFKGRVVLDVEWNAKDGNLDRDLASYRSWYEAGVISAGVIIRPAGSIRAEIYGKDLSRVRPVPPRPSRSVASPGSRCRWG
ncbi:hypothetical protein LHA35_26810, partial [Roseicella sp. GB24]|nr:hypothetical protein [Roseicella aerolata]